MPGDDDELRSDINVTPLVDVMLVLLVIFMAVTPLLRSELPLASVRQDQAGPVGHGLNFYHGHLTGAERGGRDDMTLIFVRFATAGSTEAPLSRVG